MRQKYEASVFPALQKFEPELILISAGFDAHEADPLGELNWSTEDFSWLTERLCTVASNCCEGRLVSILEGGYNLDALADSVKAHVIKLCEA
jgi:acetoin utilization deacetylase AcuC-like enzyme